MQEDRLRIRLLRWMQMSAFKLSTFFQRKSMKILEWVFAVCEQQLGYWKIAAITEQYGEPQHVFFKDSKGESQAYES